MTHSDQRYITALVNNDRSRIEEIYGRFLPRIRQLVVNNSGTDGDAADIFQEALLMIYRKAVNNDFTLTCPLEAFLYLVCKNRWINELQKRKHRPVTIMAGDGFDIKDEEQADYRQLMLDEERRELIEEKLRQMDEGCRQLLRLSWSGNSLESVAAQLNFSYAYVRKKKSGCMGKLMRLIRSSERYEALQW